MIARCIKPTYTWEGDGKQHPFCHVKVGEVYYFRREGDTFWFDFQKNKNYFGITSCERGLNKKYFYEMFEEVAEMHE